MANIMTLFILQFTFLWSLFVATDLSYLAQRGNPKDKLFWRLVNWINIMFWWQKRLKRRVDFLDIVNLGIFQENNNASMQFPKCLSLSEHYVTLWKIWKRVVTLWKLRKFSLSIFCKKIREINALRTVLHCMMMVSRNFTLSHWKNFVKPAYSKILIYHSVDKREIHCHANIFSWNQFRVKFVR